MRARVEAGGDIDIGGLADQLGCSTRTLYRDLGVLHETGVPLVDEKKAGRTVYKALEPYGRKTLSLTLPELLSIVVAAGASKGSRDLPLLDALEVAVDRIRAVLPAALAKRAERVGRSVVGRPGAVLAPEKESEAAKVLVSAMEAGHTVRITYRKHGNRTAEERTVDPHRVFVQPGAMYLYAWDHLRQAPRTFDMARLHAAVDLGVGFQVHADVAGSEILHGAFGPWSGRAYRIRLRFSKHVADSVIARQWHPDESLQMDHDGRVELQLHMPLAPALIRWIAGWGVDVDVLQPQALKRKVFAHLQAAMRH